MKRFFKKLLICIMLFILLFNFAFENPVHASVTVNDVLGGILEGLGTLADGIAGLLTYPQKIMALAAETAIIGILGAIATTFGYTDAYGNASTDGDIGLFGADDIFFNRILLTDINIFNVDVDNSDEDVTEFRAIESMRSNIALWYYVMRVIAIAILLGILVFIAIRMSISTIASDKAHYKKMLVDWSTSVALVFLLHYVIVIVCKLNSTLVDILAGVSVVDNLDNAVGELLGHTMAFSFTASWSAIVVSAMLIIQSLAFLIYYIKRMITLSFLVIISPLITITYSIDRLGDGKAQALNNWLKEFGFTVIIQPFHCITYLAFVSMATSALAGQGGGFDVFGGMGVDSLISGILAILCIKFVWDAEKIIKKIFGIQVSDNLDALKSAAVAGAVLKKGMNAAKGATKAGKKLAVKTGLNKSRLDRAKSRHAAIERQLAETTDPAKKAELRKKRDASERRVHELQKKKEEKTRKRENSKFYQNRKKITGAIGNVGDKIGGVFGLPKGQFWKRYVASSAGVVSSMIGGGMSYGSDDSSSLIDAAAVGIGAYNISKHGVLNMFNRKKSNYIDNFEDNNKTLCEYTNENYDEKTVKEKAAESKTADIMKANGDFKDLSKDQSEAEKNVEKLLKNANPNLSDAKCKSGAKAIVQGISNDIFDRNLDLDKIAKDNGLDVNDLRDATMDFGLKRAYQQMSRDNENLDTVYGEEGFHEDVLATYVDENYVAEDMEKNEIIQNVEDYQNNVKAGGKKDANYEEFIELLGKDKNKYDARIDELIELPQNEDIKLANGEEVTIDVNTIEDDIDFENSTVLDNIETITAEFCMKETITEQEDINKVRDKVQQIVEHRKFNDLIDSIQ